MNASAETLDFVRDRVIHVVGHELRTPVTTVRGLAELMATATDEELRDTLLPALLRNARRTERLLDDLLLAAEVGTVRPTDDAEVVDLADVVTEVVAGTGIRVDGWPEGRVRAHRDSVCRAVGHLVTNAERYHDDDPFIRFESDDQQVAVVVVTPVDRQIGDLELVFELFFRGEIAVTRAPGLGVGLAAAKALARLDGGDVTIEQVEGQVVTRLLLPRAA
jgi:signal transduction histidine kinase